MCIRDRAQAITTVFGAIHASEPDQALLSYQYLQMLPKLAQGDANKVWVIPSELNDALKGLGSTVGDVTRALAPADKSKYKSPERVDVFAEIADAKKVAEEESQRSVRPVSYTHLDVYQRQRCVPRAPSACRPTRSPTGASCSRTS